jgi:hypothetical protein
MILTWKMLFVVIIAKLQVQNTLNNTKIAILRLVPMLLSLIKKF